MTKLVFEVLDEEPKTRWTSRLNFAGLEVLDHHPGLCESNSREGTGKAGDMGEHACSVAQLDLGCKSLLSSPPKSCY